MIFSSAVQAFLFLAGARLASAAPQSDFASSDLTRSYSTLICQVLNIKYPSEVHLSSESSYAGQNVYWAGNTAATPPCILTPTTHPTAADMLKTLTTSSVQFAIRAGGHSMNNGFSSTANGVLFSLSGLNKLEINEQAQIASIGPGRRWGSVYSELSPRGYTVAGGRATNVGVGGLSLGGGISFWVYSHGFGADNIVSYVVALASGEIKEVTAQSDNDLWRALKGSGAPFVLVLEFRYKLIKMPDPTGLVWGGSTVSSGQSLAGVIRETAVFARNALDPKSHLITIIGMVQGALEAILTIKVYQEPQPEGVVPAVFQGLADAQAPYAAFSDVKNQRIEIISEGQSPQSVQGQRQIMKQLTVSNPDEAFLTKCAEILREELSGPSAQFGVTITMGFVPLGPVASTPKDNIMGVSGEKLMSIHYHATWVPAEGDGPIIQGVNNGISRMTQAAKDAGIWNKWVYLNYASADQNPIASYGSQNIALLKRVQARVDPWRRWETLVRDGFKIPR